MSEEWSELLEGDENEACDDFGRVVCDDPFSYEEFTYKADIKWYRNNI